MTREELARAVQAEHDGHLTITAAKEIVCDLFDIMARALLTEGRVQIADFGIFTMKEYKAHQGVNPSTGKPITIPKKKRITFTTSKPLKERIAKL